MSDVSCYRNLPRPFQGFLIHKVKGRGLTRTSIYDINVFAAYVINNVLVRGEQMKVYIGADHRGYGFKKKIIKVLNDQKYDVIDMGSYESSPSCDYPKIAYKVASKVAKLRDGRGIFICMSGIGQAMAANKVRGAYAALCYNAQSAALSRKHNNANILVLGAKFVKEREIGRIIRTWFETDFEGGRHRRRVNQIKKIEKGLKI